MLSKLIFFSAFIFYFVGLLLPYITYDQMIFQPSVTSPATFGSDLQFVKGAVLMSYESILGYISIIWMLYPALKILRNSQDAIRQAFISLVSLFVIHGLLYYGLTKNPSWYHQYLNVELSLGYWININATIICLLATISMWMRNKRLSTIDKRNDDLLDNSI